MSVDTDDNAGLNDFINNLEKNKGKAQKAVKNDGDRQKCMGLNNFIFCCPVLRFDWSKT